MTKTELEKKHLAELHTLAAKAGVERYRMLPRAELIAKLADGDGGGGDASSAKPERSGGSAGERERPPRRRRRRSSAGGESGGEGRGQGPREPRERRPERKPRSEPTSERKSEPTPEPEPEPETPSTSVPAPAAAAPAASPRPRRRRRRRFGRRGKQEVTLQGLLLPPIGRQALLAAETRGACTALLRGIAADLSDESNGPDPVALLVDPTPEELADWRRDAPKAEIVAAGQPRHASDALAQAVSRASAGDHVILLVDSLTRLGEAYEDPDAAKEFFDAGRTTAGTGSLTVVAALERPASS